MTNMQSENDKKNYMMQELHPYYFDHTLYMSTFPPTLKQQNLIDIEEKGILEIISKSFFTACIEFVYKDT